MLIDAKANVNDVDSAGNSAVHFAAGYGRVKVTESGGSQLLAKSSGTTGGIQKVEQMAPLRDGPAAWAWDFSQIPAKSANGTNLENFGQN